MHTVKGEVIKMIHGELPAVRWTCGGCGEDACTVFEPESEQREIECEECGSVNTVSKSYTE